MKYTQESNEGCLCVAPCSGLEEKTQFQSWIIEIHLNLCVLSLELTVNTSQVVVMNQLAPTSCSVVLFLFQLFYITVVYLY